MAASGPAIAQTSEIDRAARQQELIIQRAEAERRAAEEAARRRVAPTGGTAPGVTEIAEGDGPCVQIDRVDIAGAKLLPADAERELLAQFEGECLKASGLQNVIRALTNWYVEEGYITSRAYLGPQDLSSGVLKVLVVEGRQSSSAVLDNGEPRRFGRKNALKSLDGKITNLRQIEQRLDQINRLPSHDAKIAIEPGDEVGTSRVVVNTDVQDRFRLHLGIDNNGAESTGEWQTSASLSAFDVLGLYESIALTWNGDAETQMFDLGPEGSRSYSASIEGPYGSWTGRLSASYFDYASLLHGVSQTFSNEGQTWNIAVEGERLIRRDQISKTWVLAGLRVKETETYVEDVFVQTASRRLAIGHLGLGHSHALAGGLLEVSGGLRQGLDAFGAKKDGKLDFPGQDPGPRAQFTTFYFDGTYTKPFQIAEQNLLWRSTLHGAASSAHLFGSERLSMGGLYSVRGYRGHAIYGESGAYSRNELIWSLPLFNGGENAVMAEAKRLLGIPQLFAALDAGVIADDADDSFEGGRIAGAAFGLRLTGGVFTLEAAWEEPLYHPSWFEADHDDPDGIFALKAGLNIAF